MKIFCEVQDENTRKACSIMMKHNADQSFLDKIRAVKKFNFTEHSPQEVSLRIQAIMPHLEIHVRPYKSVNPFSRAIGYAEGNIIYVNTRKLYLPYYDRIENIMHEALHLCGYQHDGNRVTQFNLKTVPYLAASIFKNHIYNIYQ